MNNLRWIRALGIAALLVVAPKIQAVTFEFIVSPVPESAGSINAIFRISATAAEAGGPEGCFIDGDLGVITPSVTGAIAEAGSDYEDPGFVGFQRFFSQEPGPIQEDIPITITLLADNQVEPFTESYGLSYTSGESIGGSCFGTPVPDFITSTGVINDDDALNYAFTPTSVTVPEEGGPVTTDLALTNPGDAPVAYNVTIDVSAQSGTALAGDDFQPVAQNLSFSAAQTSQPFSVTLIDDLLVEDNETFQIATTGGVGATDDSGNPILVQISNALAVTIVSDDVPDILAVTQTAISAAEDAGSVAVSVSRTGTLAGVVSVDYASFDVSATEALDYQAVSGTLTFGAGEAGPLTINVPLVDDNLFELPETLDIELSGPQGSAVLGASVAIIEITDDDTDVVGFSATQITAGEGDGTVVVEVTRTGSALGVVSVDFATAPGSAVAGSDYVATNGTLTFESGVVGPLQISVDLLDDGSNEDDEDFDLLLTNPTGPGTIGSGVVTVTVTDDDVADVVGFAVADVSAGEGDGTLVIDVTRAGNALEAVTVDFATVAGTATEGSDYVAANGTLTFGQGVTGPLQISVDLLDDGDDENDESFDLLLTNLVGSATIGLGTVSVTLTDDDAPPPVGSEGDIVFPGGDFAIAEDGGTVTVSVARLNGTLGGVSVDYSITGGDAVAGEDYQFTPGSLSWADGEGGEKSFQITIVDDAAVEDAESLTLELANFVALGASPAPRQPLANPGGGGSGAQGAAAPQGLGNPSAIVVTITDNDVAGSSGTLEFVSDAVTVNEADGTVDIEVARSGAPVGAVSVDWATVEDSAEEGGDFVAASGTLVWPDGDDTNKVITVELTSDIDIEGVEEFGIQLSNPQGAVVGTVASATVAISDVGQSLAQVAGLNPEELAFATALDASCENLIADADPDDADQQDLLFICGTVRNGLETPEQVREAIDALSGDELVTAASSTLKLLGLQHNTFRNRLSGLRSGNTGSVDLSGLAVEIDGQYLSGAVLEEMFGALTGGAAGEGVDFGRFSVYVNGKLEFGEKDEDAANRGYDFDAQMLTFGADYRLNDNIFIGGAIGYERADIDFSEGGGLDVGGWKGSVYGSYFSGDAFYVDAQASYGRDNYDSERRIVYDYVGGSIDRTAEGKTDGDQFTTGIASGFDFNRGRLTFGPNVALAYFNVGVQSFVEEGAGGLNLEIGRQIQESLTLTAGAHLSYVINSPLGVLIPHARVDYVHEFMNAPESSNVRFATDPLTADPASLVAPLQVQAERIDKDYLLWSVGSSMQLTHGVSGYVTYQSTEGYSGLKLQQIAYGLRLEKTY